jgi:hypothetical protein
MENGLGCPFGFHGWGVWHIFREVRIIASFNVDGAICFGNREKSRRLSRRLSGPCWQDQTIDTTSLIELV